jgi:hypothetical protein
MQLHSWLLLPNLTRELCSHDGSRRICASFDGLVIKT